MVGRVRATALPLLRRDLDASEYVEHLALDGRHAFIARRVLLDLARLEAAEHPDETAGLLFGRYFSDGEHPCTIVTDLVIPEPGEVIGTPSTVTITATGAETMIARAWGRSPLLTPVGWAHTHPCFEAYFSGTDRAEQRAWGEPGSVGLVLSGLPNPREPYRLFMGPESTAARRVRDAHSAKVIAHSDHPPTERRDATPQRPSIHPPLRGEVRIRRDRIILVAISLAALIAAAIAIHAALSPRGAHHTQRRPSSVVTIETLAPSSLGYSYEPAHLRLRLPGGEGE
jgi:proteasome lid subunit RPN8/RPN11